MSAPKQKPDVIDSRGSPVALGSTLGAGAEGTVYEVKQASDRAAKIYPQPLPQDKVNKIRAMVGMKTESLTKLMSWPVDLLIEKQSNRPIGLLIPRIHNKKNVHHLYGPKSRLQDFPRADWRFLIRAATNVSKAFAVVHDTGCVIGDVNHGSIMVGGDATVSLVDCESFQVKVQGQQYFCDFGIETFMPPELQAVTSYRNIVRTANYDNFGLAVMIFHLLFMGRHPFAGKYSGAGNMPIPQAIRECRFPYSANHKAMQMERPPGTPPLSFVGADVAHLFETAFGRPAINNGRPTARDWVTALQRLELNTKQCGVDKGHWFPSHLSSCPWCQMEAQGANPLFPFVVPLVPGGSTIDVDALLRQIQNLQPLGNAPAIPIPSVAVSSAAAKLGPPSGAGKGLAALIGLAIFIFGSVMAPPGFWIFGIIGGFVYNFLKEKMSNDSEIAQFRGAVYLAENHFNLANKEWQSRAGEATFISAKARFDAARLELKDFPAKRVRALEVLKQNHRKLQLDRFLDRFELEDAKIDGIGPGRKRTLESYGIETAEDIVPHRINAVPGFGPVMIEKLMNWRRSIEAKFVFDPTKGIDARDIAKVEQQIQVLRAKAETNAKAAHAELMLSHSRILAARKGMRPQMDALQLALAQAKVDYEFVKG